MSQYNPFLITTVTIQPIPRHHCHNTTHSSSPLSQYNPFLVTTVTGNTHPVTADTSTICPLSPLSPIQPTPSLLTLVQPILVTTVTSTTHSLLPVIPLTTHFMTPTALAMPLSFPLYFIPQRREEGKGNPLKWFSNAINEWLASQASQPSAHTQDRKSRRPPSTTCS